LATLIIAAVETPDKCHASPAGHLLSLGYYAEASAKADASSGFLCFGSYLPLAVAAVAMPFFAPASAHLFHLFALVSSEVLVKVNAESKH
jgi:hypothetical protein